jgi:hypothetical protein
MRTVRKALQFTRDNWLIILAVVVNLAIAGPVSADWNNAICHINNQAVPCCTDCTFFCFCGDSPAP